MTESRQRPISVTSRDREALDRHKRRYEDATGEPTDWGSFLGTIALLGLAAAGIYRLATARRRSPQTVDVECCWCQSTFLMVVPLETGRAIYTTCPACDAELVVDLGAER